MTAVLEVLRRNVLLAKNIIRLVTAKLGGPRICNCGTALDGALMTDPKRVPAATRRRLELLLGNRLTGVPQPKARGKKGTKIVRRSAAARVARHA